MIMHIQPDHYMVSNNDTGRVVTYSSDCLERMMVLGPELVATLEQAVRLIQKYENPQNIVSSVQLDALEVLARVKGE